MKEFLAKKPSNALRFSFGINSGLRISYILALNVEDVRGKEYIKIREKKTNKRKAFSINENLKQEIEEFTKDLPPEQSLFYTQQHRRMERSRAYKMSERLRKVNVEFENILKLFTFLGKNSKTL